MHDEPTDDLAALVPDAVTRRERIVAALAAVMLVVGGVTVATNSGAELPSPSALPSDVEPPEPVRQEQAARARLDHGCDVLVDGEPLEDRTHLDPDDAPPARALYPDHRPAHSGRHYPSVASVPTRIADEPIDERAVLHNMEHGSVVVWFEQGRVTQDELVVLETWLRERLALGFVSDAAGAIFASPSHDISSGLPFAFRAWGVAMDCKGFDVTVADAFLQDHWGSNGASPEAHLSPFPPGVLGGTGTAV